MVVDGNRYIMNDIKTLEWLEIFLWYKCNIYCKFCYQKDLRLYYKNNLSKDKVINLLNEWYNNWKRFVIFSWWEPTLDKNLEYYIEYSKKIWFIHIRVHTNWFWFKNYSYLLNLYNKWLNWVTISVHWYKGIHDRIVWLEWNFDIIFKALINFEKLKQIDNNFVFDTNTVICKDNIKTLVILFKFLLKFSISRRMLVYPYNIESDKNELIRILPNNDLYIKYIENISELCYISNIKDFVIETIPYCLINKKYWLYIEKNYKTNKNTYFIDWEKEKNIQYNIWKIKFEECSNCIKNNICYWFSRDYFSVYWKPDFNIIIS